MTCFKKTFLLDRELKIILAIYTKVYVAIATVDLNNYMRFKLCVNALRCFVAKCYV